MKLSVVIPTVTGREELLARTKAAYLATRGDWDFEFVVVKNAGNAGKGWNKGAAQTTGEYVHFTADDILPHPGWLEAAAAAADADEYPAPRLVLDDGSLQTCGGTHGDYIHEELEDGTPVESSQLPFFRAGMWSQIGPGLPIHYYADNYLSVRAAKAGLTVVFRRDYCFTHVNGDAHSPAMVAQKPAHATAFWNAVNA